MNFATQWCIALHNLSALPPIGSHDREQSRRAWNELVRAATFVAAEIQAGANRG